MTDANIRIPTAVRDRLAAIAAGEGMSLRAYLAHLVGTLLTPAERAKRAERTCEMLREWNGYDPTPTEETSLDAELDRRMTEAGASVI
ncbi:hypothetical protein [Streptomyces yerevanensis]|uniref:hypothetical protein n=1 Tax=Streptomyces yerevanensis TaxID=66378 RepID=UPI000524FE9D|nr:hypothetical protein [Streptomyces yerevanensis]